MRISLYSMVLSVLGSDNFLVPTEKDALRAMQPSMPAKESSRQQANGDQGSTRIYPQTVAKPKRATSIQPDALQKTQVVYRCRENNAQTVFSDQPCGDIQQVMPLKHLQPNIAETFQKVVQKNLSNTAEGLNQTGSRTRNPANQQEINTRYDDLSRVINHLSKDDRRGQIRLLMKLNKDRQNALSMYATSSDSYVINQRFDNLRRDIRRQENKQNKMWVAHRLLTLERQRNRELYD